MKTPLIICLLTLLCSPIGISGENPVFPKTPLEPTRFEAPASIAPDLATLQNMAVSSASLYKSKFVYRGSGYEDLPDARNFFPDLFLTLPDGRVISKSRIRGYYNALFCSWVGNQEAILIHKQLLQSKHDWIAYGASTIKLQNRVDGRF